MNNNINLPKPEGSKFFANLLRACYILLIIWGIAVEFTYGKYMLAIKVIPILICIYGIIKLDLYKMQWGIMILHIYLLEGIVSLTSSKYPFNVFGGITLFLTLGAYISSLIYLRPYKKYHKQMKKLSK
ncbi:MAG: hypothetical protein RLZZ210_132 [Pseudomonadota bacterium]|jgi:uncharacterized membrane protein